MLESTANPAGMLSRRQFFRVSGSSLVGTVGVLAPFPHGSAPTTSLPAARVS